MNKWRAVTLLGSLLCTTRQKKVSHKPPPSNLVTIKNWEAQMVASKLGCAHVRSPRPWREGVTVHSAKATSKKALVNVVFSPVQPHGKFRAQLRKYYLESPVFLASWAHHRCGWFPVMIYLCRPPPPPKQYQPILLKFAFFLLYGFKPALLLLTSETSHMDLVYESSRMIPTFPSFLHIWLCMYWLHCDTVMK